METTCNLPILALKLTKGEHECFETWRRQYLGCPDKIEKEWMDRGFFGSDA